MSEKVQIISKKLQNETLKQSPFLFETIIQTISRIVEKPTSEKLLTDNQIKYMLLV